MKTWTPILLTLVVVFGCTSPTQKGVNVKAKEDAKQINNPSLWPKPSNPVAQGSEGNNNLKVVQSFYEAYGKEDLEGIRQVMSEDVEWYIPGQHPVSGTKRGIPEILDFFRKLQIAGFRAKLMIMAANENYVIDAHRGWSNTGKGDIDLNWVLIYQIEKGKIKRVQNFSGDLYASDEFFSRMFGK